MTLPSLLRGQFQDNLDAFPPGGPQSYRDSGAFPLSPRRAPRLARGIRIRILYTPARAWQVLMYCILIKTAVSRSGHVFTLSENTYCRSDLKGDYSWDGTVTTIVIPNSSR
eukprot:scaffold1162_cov94-Skeletonema_dohrnii-CCMP3373.AAC.2